MWRKIRVAGHMPLGKLTVLAAWMIGVWGASPWGFARLGWADTPAPQATPEELGMRLPQAPALPGGNRPVLVPADAATDQPTVGRVYLEVGDHYVVLLPDGSLVSLPASLTTPTDRPFVPLEKRQLGDQLTSCRFPGFKSFTTNRYLYVYDSSPAFAKATSRILESMYPALERYFANQGVKVADPEFPLVVIMFRDQEDFERYRKMPDGVAAYYNALSNHIVLYEQSKLMEVAPDLAFKQAVSTIAHEGVHQILYNIGVQQRLSYWPSWFSEGLAEYFAPTQVDRRVKWKGVGLVNDLRLHELSEFYRQREGAMSDGQLLRRAVESRSLESLDYATSWAMIHYLSRFERDKFQACLQDVSQLAPLQRLPPGSLFGKHFSTDYAGVEAKLVDYLASLPYVNPILNQTHYVMVVQGDKWEYLITSSPRELMRFQREKASGGNYRIQAFPNRSAADRFVQGMRSLHR